jgi:hypothetical protein
LEETHAAARLIRRLRATTSLASRLKALKEARADGARDRDIVAAIDGVPGLRDKLLARDRRARPTYSLSPVHRQRLSRERDESNLRARFGDELAALVKDAAAEIEPLLFTPLGKNERKPERAMVIATELAASIELAARTNLAGLEVTPLPESALGELCADVTRMMRPWKESTRGLRRELALPGRPASEPSRGHRESSSNAASAAWASRRRRVAESIVRAALAHAGISGTRYRDLTSGSRTRAAREEAALLSDLRRILGPNQRHKRAKSVLNRM